MPTRVQTFSSSITQGVTPLSRAPTTRSISSEVELSNTVHIVNPEARIIEVTTQPDFYIFTSLIWIRTPPQNPEVGIGLENVVNRNFKVESAAKSIIPDGSQPELGLLRYHRDRLVDTAEALRWRHIQALEPNDYGLGLLHSSIIMYLQCLPSLPPDRIERRKLRVMVNKLGMIKIDSTVMDCPLARDTIIDPATFLPPTLDLDNRVGSLHQPAGLAKYDLKLSRVFLDICPSRPSLFTTHKTSHRGQYNRARMRARIAASAPTDKEVLLYNKNGEVMEASLCSVYFYRYGKWITPAAICGGNLGVTRRLALESGLCIQGTVEVSEVVDGERIWLSNGARGFFVGQICLERRVQTPVSECGTSP